MALALAAFVAVAVACLLYAERRRHLDLVRPFKVLASTGFLALGLSVGALSSVFGRYVFLSLSLCWIGDLLLTYDSRRAFLAGLVSFLLGHIAYVASFVVRGYVLRSTSVFVLGVLPALVGLVLVWRWLSPHLDRVMRVAVLAYMVVISIMFVLAVGTTVAASQRVTDLRVVVAAALFYISDLLVAREKFIVRSELLQAVGRVLYFTAQVIFAMLPRDVWS